ncbi:hypothetical protein [Streptomyces rubiginosohelvolus]|uniref:hypothetical protein n=1 Tax=Streptomyces rubiginosohelvolus TaxID=67362 RepID=UPI003689E33C
MDAQNSTLAAPTAMTPADIAAHAAGSHVRRSAVRTQVCQETILDLSARDARTLSPADMDRLSAAHAELDRLTNDRRG